MSFLHSDYEFTSPPATHWRPVSHPSECAIYPYRSILPPLSDSSVNCNPGSSHASSSDSSLAQLILPRFNPFPRTNPIFGNTNSINAAQPAQYARGMSDMANVSPDFLERLAVPPPDGVPNGYVDRREYIGCGRNLTPTVAHIREAHGNEAAEAANELYLKQSSQRRRVEEEKRLIKAEKRLIKAEKERMKEEKRQLKEAKREFKVEWKEMLKEEKRQLKDEKPQLKRHPWILRCVGTVRGWSRKVVGCHDCGDELKETMSG